MRRRLHKAHRADAEISIFITKLRAREGAAARALEFAILTAARLEFLKSAFGGKADIAFLERHVCS
jgi:hypothetical protein